MFQVIHLETKKNLGEQCFDHKEAEQVATAHFRRILEASPMGRRTLQSLSYKLPWSLVTKHYMIEEMVGVWIKTEGGRVTPNDNTDENTVVFIDNKGHRHMGMFDDGEGLYLDELGTTYTAENVVRFLIIPDDDYEVADS